MNAMTSNDLMFLYLQLTLPSGNNLFRARQNVIDESLMPKERDNGAFSRWS